LFDVQNVFEKQIQQQKMCLKTIFNMYSQSSTSNGWTGNKPNIKKNR